jgi:hypothetical protein
VHELGFDALWVHSGYFDIIQQHKALGRGHHGGGDWEAGWDLPKLRTAMGLHPGFTSPTQCVKYMLGSHDQVGGGGGLAQGAAALSPPACTPPRHQMAAAAEGDGGRAPRLPAFARLPCRWVAATVASGISTTRRSGASTGARRCGGAGCRCAMQCRREPGSLLPAGLTPRGSAQAWACLAASQSSWRNPSPAV